MTLAPQDTQATYCATLVDEWVALGVAHAVIAPGSRSTPMALAIVERSEIRTHVVHDERSAAFVALGLGLGGVPALLLCTSGTAAANFFPAVVEAGLSEVPMVVLTADRPDELRGVGAPQTIDQLDLFGRHARWFADPGVPEESTSSTWRDLAVDAWSHASRGPVQLNLAFREPLIGNAADLPAARRTSAPGRDSGAGLVDTRSLPGVDVERGIIVVGGRSGVSPDDVVAVRAQTGWPIVADPLSGIRQVEGVISTADALLRNSEFATQHLPAVIVRIGRPAASKVLAQWTHQAAIAGATLLQVGGPGVIDPDHDVSDVCTIDELLSAVDRGAARNADRQRSSTWRTSWEDADRLADSVIASTLAEFDELTEPLVARTVAEHLPAGAQLTVASSMPVRDLEWFGGRSARAHANRGANGIDGVISTALGIGLTGRPSVVLVGDLAAVHDSNALIALGSRGADVRIVVVDNDGGGIFSFLPQASALTPERFEQLFGTPLGVDIVALAAAHGVASRSVQTTADLIAQLELPGPWLVRVRSERRRNVVIHDAIHAAVIDAVGRRGVN